MAHGGQRLVEGALQAAELVVRGADAVEADADVVEAVARRCAGQRLVDERAVGGQADVEASCALARSAISKMSGRSSGSPPERMSAGTLKAFRSSITPNTSLRAQLAGVVVVGARRRSSACR
jgi:hypothetical protein